jgi:hypothetical protein
MVRYERFMIWEKVIDWSSPFNDWFLKMSLLRFYPGATLGKKETNWKWRWCGGILGFYSVRQIFFQSDSFSKLPDRMSDKLSWIFDMSVIWSRLLWNTIQVWPTLLVHISFLKQSYYVYLSLVHRPFRNNPQIFSCWDFFLMDVFEH